MTKVNAKAWFTSKTIWIALIQGIIGILVAVMDVSPEIKATGLIAILKSVLDILTRFKTESKVTV